MKSITRTLSTGIAAIFLAASPAFSNELTDFFTKFNPADPCDWSGVYFGLNVGGTWNHFDIGKQRTEVNLTRQFYMLLEGDEEGGDGIGGEADVFATFHAPGHSETSGQTIGGMQSGLNLQFGHFVFGAEGSFIGNGTTASKHFEDFQTNELFLFTLQQNVTAETLFHSWRMAETTWNGFVGGKIGYCWNRFLFYGIGGAAFTDVRFTSMQKADTAFFGFIGDGDGQALAAHTKTRSVADKHAVVNQQQGFFLGEIVNTKNRSETELLTGYYGGVGTEYKLTNNVSVAFEYKRVDWGDKNGNFAPGPNDGPVFPTDANIALTGDQFLFKVNIMVAHFNPFH
jgi:opacity protein-like surface antigen